MPNRTPTAALRQRFADAAWKLGCTGGYEAVKIRAIADDVGVSAALIYSYFDDKAALMDELRALGCTRLVDALDDVAGHQHGRTALSRLCQCYVQHMRSHAWLYAGASKLELHGPHAPHAQAFIVRAAQLLQELGDAGHDAPAATLALHLWLALRGVLGLGGELVVEDPEFIPRHVELVLSGLTRATGAPAPGVDGDARGHARVD